MKKNDYISLDAVSEFTDWLCGVLFGKTTLGYRTRNLIYENFDDALLDYKWPPKNIVVESPLGLIKIASNSNAADNQVLLDMFSEGLKEALASSQSETLVGAWVKCILQWGGVYTYSKGGQQGNRGWLEEQVKHQTLAKYLLNVIDKISNAENDDVGLEIESLRSNAGLTKVYSLLLPNFIIYDSRVAAALSWLVAKSQGFSSEIPEALRFATMRAKTSKAEGKIRTADPKNFVYFAASGPKNFQNHLRWNIRANWILETAIENVTKSSHHSAVSNIRLFEAALFTMGDDLKHAVDGGFRK